MRQVVRAFAVRMEAKLREHDNRPGWKRDAPEALFNRLLEESQELIDAIARWRDERAARFASDGGRGARTYRTEELAEAAAWEAVDVANYAMMIADRFGLLESTVDLAAVLAEALEELECWRRKTSYQMELADRIVMIAEEHREACIGCEWVGELGEAVAADVCPECGAEGTMTTYYGDPSDRLQENDLPGLSSVLSVIGDRDRARAELAEARAKVERLRLGLRNALGIAGLMRRAGSADRVAELAEHLTRICGEAGVTPTVLRELDSGE